MTLLQRLCTFGVAIPFAMLAGAHAHAADLRTFAGIETGLGTFSFEEKLDNEVVYPVVNLTAGVAYGRFSTAVNISGSIADADVSEEDYTGDASRTDFDLIAGYQVLNNLNVFVGYKSGETELDLVGRDEEDPIRGTESYQQSGPFVGVSASWRPTETGKLDVSIAYAALDADNKFISDGGELEPGEEIEFDDIQGSTSGDSSGYSLSVSWTMPITGNLLFRTRYRYNSYEQDIEFEGAKFNDIREESSSLTVGVLAAF